MMLRRFVLFLLLLLMPALVCAEEVDILKLTGSHRGLYCVFIFLVAYGFVMTEEFTHLRKAKPVILAAGIIWAQVAYLANSHGVPNEQIHKGRSLK